MTTLKLTAIGNSTGVIFPKELLAKLHMEKGGTLYATEIPNGIVIKTYNDEFVNDMEMAEHIIYENRNVLKKLADS